MEFGQDGRLEPFVRVRKKAIGGFSPNLLARICQPVKIEMKWLRIACDVRKHFDI